IGRGEFDKTIDRDAAAQHALREQQWQSRLDARDSVRDVAERNLLAARLLALGCVIAKRSVVRGEDGEQSVGQSVPDYLLVVAIAWWRAAHAARAQVTIVDAEVFSSQEQILRAGFGEHVEAVGAGPADLLDRLTAGHVHDHDRYVDQLRKRDR